MGSNKLPYFPFHADDWLNDPAVVQMDSDAEGCYIRLLARSWKSPTPGVVFEGHISELCGSHRLQEQYRLLWRDDVKSIDMADETASGLGWSRWKEIKDQIAYAFDTTSRPEYWVQRRMLAEYERLSTNLRSRQAAAAATNEIKASDGHRNGKRAVTVTVSERSPSRSPAEEVEVEVEESKTKTRRSPKGSRVFFEGMTLPPEIPSDVWGDWCTYRAGLGARYPWTKRAAELSIEQLVKIAEAGLSPKASVEASIMNGWRGLFSPKGEVPPAADASDGWEVTR